MEEKIRISFFDAKEYDKDSFNLANTDDMFEIKFFDTKLSEDTYKLAAGSDVVCIFVNDEVNKEVIDGLVQSGVKLIALRCAGYNNVDIEYAFGCQTANYNRVQQQIKIPSDTYQTARSCL